MSIVRRIFPSATNALRPRLACEITPAGVLAGRPGSVAVAGEAQDIRTSFAPLRMGVLAPGLKTPNLLDRAAVAAALRQALDDLVERERKVTVIVPDASARVLLLDFDTLPARQSDALPILRFRLRKLVPFDVEDAAIGYQVMPSAPGETLVRTVAAVMPGAVRAEYEDAVREAGYEPGAILPSSLAALAAVPGEEPALLVNRNANSITTAITRGNTLLLYRTLELGENTPDMDMGEHAPAAEIQQSVSVAMAYFEDTLATAPQTLFAAGPGGARELSRMLDDDSVRVRDLVPAGSGGSSAAATPRARNDDGIHPRDNAGNSGRRSRSARKLMRITLNLASRPYLELRPLYQRLRLLMLLLVITAAALWWVLRTEHARAAAAQARVDAIQNSVTDVQRQRQRSEAEMRQPDNAAALAQAQFLNNLFLHKAFSWTAVMMDLEQVLPTGVQVMNIDPQIAKDGHVTIRMRVAGPRERAVELMRNLEHSRRFLQPRLVGEATQSNAQGANLQAVSTAPNGVNFDILADYNPLPERAKGTGTKQEGTTGDSGTTPHRRGRRTVPKPSAAATTAPAQNAAAQSPRAQNPTAPNRAGQNPATQGRAGQSTPQQPQGGAR